MQFWLQKENKWISGLQLQVEGLYVVGFGDLNGEVWLATHRISWRRCEHDIADRVSIV